MFLTKDELNNNIKVIQHKEKAIQLNFIELGQLLLLNKHQSLYKQKYANFEVFIEDNFSFSPQQAYKFIRVAEKFPGLSSDTVTAKLGLEKLYALTYIEGQEALTEYLEEVSENPRPLDQIKREVKRFKPESRQTGESRELEIQRKLDIIILELTDLIETKSALIEKAKKMLEFAEDYPYQLNKIKELLEVLK